MSSEESKNAKAADDAAHSSLVAAMIDKDGSPQDFAIDEISLAAHRRAIAYGRARGDA